VFRLEYEPNAREDDRAREASPPPSRLRHDLALAAQIQRSFLPREVIAVEGVDLFAEYRAAYTIGGDFYDVFWIGPDRLAVFVGDVSGKGISAALLMARISSELRVAALAHVDPVAVLTAMNTATLARGQSELFFTAIYFTLDVKTGDIVLANAGHTMPYSRRASGQVEPITGGRACPVGILENAGFAATRLRLDHGDSLVLYTDGVIEAASADGSFYGQERLEACLAGPGPRTSHAIAERILESVDAHSAEGPVNDDLTLLICQRSVGGPRTMQPRRGSSRLPATRPG
jgi:sigma-B regulation protein RsbU (phosphoserine phosphatase)